MPVFKQESCCEVFTYFVLVIFLFILIFFLGFSLVILFFCSRPCSFLHLYVHSKRCSVRTGCHLCRKKFRKSLCDYSFINNNFTNCSNVQIKPFHPVYINTSYTHMMERHQNKIQHELDNTTTLFTISLRVIFSFAFSPGHAMHSLVHHLFELEEQHI